MKGNTNITIIAVILSTILLSTSVDSKQWTKLIDKTHEWSIKYSQELKQIFEKIVETKNISIPCNTSIWQTVEGIHNLEVWAIDMINSWGSFPPSGVRTGTSTDFGSYDQCLAIEPNNIIGKPQYCLINWRPPIPRPMPVHHNLHHRIEVLPKNFKNNFNKTMQNVFESYSEFASFFYWITLRTGICTPSQCSLSDISSLAEGFADSYGLELNRTRCETLETEIKLNPIQVLAILFIMCYIVLSLMATLFEKFWSEDNPKDTKIIELFSLKQNLRCLLAKKSSVDLSCLHGIRVISMLWVIFGHTTEWMDNELFARAFVAKDIFSRIDIQLVYSGFFAVETFLFIGGMLTSYVTFQYTGGQYSNFNIFGFLVSRVLRLTLQYMISILLTFLLPLGWWAGGPIWNETIDPLIEKCSANWWWNLLYIQNWLPRGEQCAVHTWYLACDMQLHWFSLLFIIPLLYKLKIGLYITGGAIFLFYLTIVIIAYWLDLPPGFLKTGLDEYFWINYVELFYFKPWSHTTVFFIGFLMGLIAYKKLYIKLNGVPRFIIMCLVIVGLFISLMDTYFWNSGNPWNRLLSAFIYSTSRLIWSVSLSALVWMCISGNGGIINTFLSSPVFTFFSRLTYSSYLVHSWVLWIFIGTRRERLDTNVKDIFLIFVHNAILVYFVGFVFSLLFETPVLRFLALYSKKINNTVEAIGEDPEVSIKFNDKNNNNNKINSTNKGIEI